MISIPPKIIITKIIVRFHRMHCNCSSILSVGEAIAFDANGFESIPRGILLNDHQSIWLADENGCECRQIVNMSGSSVLSKCVV